MNWAILNYFIVILTFFVYFSFEAKNKENFTSGVRLTSAKCESDNTTFRFTFCNLKPVSRKVVVLNLGLEFLVPYPKPIYSQIIVFYRYGNIFREIINTHKIEMCELIDGTASNPIFKLIFEWINSAAPDFLHKCPYTGKLNLTNYSMDFETLDKTTMLFPEGTYKSVTDFFLKDTKTITFTITYEIKSSLKELFG
jgi:hypothetical protein